MAPIRCCFDQTAVWHSDAARGPSTPSFDHLVGGEEQTGRHSEAERFGSLQIDNELELRRLRNRQVSRLRSAEDLTGIDAGLTKTISDIGAVAHQSADLGIGAAGISRGDSVSRRQRGELHPAAVKEPIWGNKQRFRTLARNRGESGIDLVTVARVEDLHLQPESPCRFSAPLST